MTRHIPSDLYALVPCAGVGERAGAGGPKQYAPLSGRSLVAHTLQALSGVARLKQVLVVLSPCDTAFEQHAPDFDGWVERCGGATRADTVREGLRALLAKGARPTDWALVHDAARCLLRPEWVDTLIDACIDDPVGGLLALPVPDTLKRSDGADPRVTATVERAGVWQAQTPQMFRIGLLLEALERGTAGITDEASAIEASGLRPRLVAGSLENFKITWPADFALAERLLGTRP